MGTYTAGAPKQLGKFVATAGVPHKEVMIDHGALYASKGKATQALAESASWLCPVATAWTIVVGPTVNVQRSMSDEQRSRRSLLLD